jgi:hypothetical protein
MPGSSTPVTSHGITERPVVVENYIEHELQGPGVPSRVDCRNQKYRELLFARAWAPKRPDLHVRKSVPEAAASRRWSVPRWRGTAHRRQHRSFSDKTGPSELER